MGLDHFWPILLASRLRAPPRLCSAAIPSPPRRAAKRCGYCSICSSAMRRFGCWGRGESIMPALQLPRGLPRTDWDHLCLASTQAAQNPRSKPRRLSVAVRRTAPCPRRRAPRRFRLLRQEWPANEPPAARDLQTRDAARRAFALSARPRRGDQTAGRGLICAPSIASGSSPNLFGPSAPFVQNQMMSTMAPTSGIKPRSSHQPVRSRS